MTFRRYRTPALACLQQGFTLLEIMLVVVIIGIMMSFVTISIGPVTDGSLDEHGRRLDVLIQLAVDEAGIQGRELGLQFYQHGYEFSSLQPQVTEKGEQIWIWVPLTGDAQFKTRDLGEDLSIDLEIEGEETSLLYEQDKEEKYEPQIFILSSGDIEPPFIASIRPTFGGTGIILDVSETGEAKITRDDF
jgi:general secretion pathway protein H